MSAVTFKVEGKTIPKAPSSILNRFKRLEEIGKETGRLEREKKEIKAELEGLFGRRKRFGFKEAKIDDKTGQPGEMRTYVIEKKDVHRDAFQQPECDYIEFKRIAVDK